MTHNHTGDCNSHHPPKSHAINGLRRGSCNNAGYRRQVRYAPSKHSSVILTDLLQLPMKDILRLQRTNSAWRDIVKTSIHPQKKLGYIAVSDTFEGMAPPPTMNELFTTSDLIDLRQIAVALEVDLCLAHRGLGGPGTLNSLDILREQEAQVPAPANPAIR